MPEFSGPDILGWKRKYEDLTKLDLVWELIQRLDFRLWVD
jgi:hypothetical protein